MTAPTAGGGDTRDGREAITGLDRIGPECDCPAEPYRHRHIVDPARPAAAPADDTGELREAIREVLSRYDVRGVHLRDVADAVLALPAVRALIDGARTDRATITAVEALATEFDTESMWTGPLVAGRIRRALGGER